MNSLFSSILELSPFMGFGEPEKFGVASMRFRFFLGCCALDWFCWFLRNLIFLLRLCRRNKLRLFLFAFQVAFLKSSPIRLQVWSCLVVLYVAYCRMRLFGWANATFHVDSTYAVLSDMGGLWALG